MSVQNVVDFKNKVKNDPELQKAVNALQGDPDGVEKFIRIAGDAGYNFTREDLAEAQKMNLASGELTEEQLKSIAGGGTTWDNACTVNLLPCHGGCSQIA